jgi:hypothetical protein
MMTIRIKIKTSMTIHDTRKIYIFFFNDDEKIFSNVSTFEKKNHAFGFSLRVIRKYSHV